MTNEEKKQDLARRVRAPQKEELAAKVQDNVNKSKKIELAAKMDELCRQNAVEIELEEGCGCNVHFTVSETLVTENGRRSSQTAKETSPDYDWDSLIAAGVNPLSLVSVESQLYQLVNSGTIRASAALNLLGYDQI